MLQAKQISHIKIIAQLTGSDTILMQTRFQRAIGNSVINGKALHAISATTP